MVKTSTEQSQRPTTMMTGEPYSHTTPSPTLPHAVYHGFLLLTMTPEPRLPAPRHNYGWTTQRAQNFIWKPLLYSAEKLLKFCNVGAIKGGASGYGCMVSVLRWCVQCSVLVRLKCMRVRVVPIPSASLPLFYLQTRHSETFRDLTMRTVSYSSYSTILSLNDYYRLVTTSSEFG